MTEEELALYKAFIDFATQVDQKPKNLFLLQDKGREYENMCISLAQGYEMDWISHNPPILVNEFGESEHFDNFKRRHPNFAEDVKNALTKLKERIEQLNLKQHENTI